MPKNDETYSTQETFSKDISAQKWIEGLRAAEIPPAQVVASFIAEGSRIANYVATEEMGWGPKIDRFSDGDGYRDMVTLYGDERFSWAGPKLGAQSLRAGISTAVKVSKSGTFETDTLYMVPYPKFDQNGTVEGGKSLVFLFNEAQFRELSELVGLPLEEQLQ